jgi:hypothetical protein
MAFLSLLDWLRNLSEYLSIDFSIIYIIYIKNFYYLLLDELQVYSVLVNKIRYIKGGLVLDNIYVMIVKEEPKMNFFCVYVKTRKKFDKYIKINAIKNKYIIDINKIISEEEVDFTEDKTYLKIIIFNKIQQAIDKKKDIYYIPDFDNEFSIEKLLNLKKILGEHIFNVLIFYNEFRRNPEVIDDVFSNLSKFSNSQIIRDY